MRNLNCTKNSLLAFTLLAALLMSPLGLRGAIVTNWVAFNDHRPGPIPPPAGQWGTARRVTGYDMRVGPAGNLTNFLNGQQLAVTLSVTPNGSPDDFGTCFEPNDNTPAANLFKGIVDVANANSVIGVRRSANTYVNLTFNNLDPAKHYVFRGTSVRGGSYPLRWTVATLLGADGFVDAHLNGSGPGVLTSNTFPADLEPGQAAYNSGDNHQGAVVGWDFISPAPDGSFSVQSSNYIGHIPGGGLADPNVYGYAVSAFLLAEVEVAAPAIVVQPPAQTTVEQNRPFTLSVTASGTPLFYQWYKQGGGPISGATFAAYSVSQATVADSGNYFVVVYNPLNSVTSTLAHVTVNADITPPSAANVFSYPTFDPATQIATLNQVIVEYNEAIQSTSATVPGNYVLTGGINPSSVTLTNQRTVVLSLSSALAEDTDYALTISGVKDLAGNTITAGPASFRTWMRGPANTLLFEVYNTGPGADLVGLTNSPVFPNNPFLTTNLWAFDTRVVFPDDSHDAYGSRTRGVFIPPVSGDWIFFLRSDDRSQVYLNPNGTDPAGKQPLVAEVTGANGDWNKLLSSPVTLQAGHGYYIEGLQKEDTSVDYIKVAARLVGTGVPPLGIPSTDIDTNALMGPAVGAPLAPRDLGGALTIVQNLPDLTVEVTHNATFALQLSNPSGLPLFYKWFRDGSEIPGATGSAYSFPVAQSDNNATFRVQVAKVGSVITSRTAKLTVIQDTNPPTVVAVHGTLLLNRVIVSFSEAVDPVNANDGFSYLIDGNAIVSATLDATGTNVMLLLQTPLSVGGSYSINVSLVQDLSLNTMNAVDVAFRAWVVSRGFALEQVYLNLGTGTSVADLLGSDKYPSAADLITWSPTLEGPTDQYDAYGTRLSGWLTVPLNGQYNFYLCSDDNSQLSLSPDDTSAGLAVIATESSYNATRTWTGDRAGGTRGNPPINIASNIAMLASQSYAFEVLQKDGTGGDNSGVNWQIPGQAEPLNGTPGIPGAYLYSLADPVGSSVTITQQPVSIPASSLPATATFSVAATSTLAGAPNALLLSYLWQRDNGAGFADILGAYASSYAVNLTSADIGARFRALVFSPGASATSQVAVVSSTLRVSASQQGNVIRISWSKPGTGVTLEQTPTLTGTPPPWTTVPANTYQTDATSVYVEITLPVAANKYYRLHQQ